MAETETTEEAQLREEAKAFAGEFKKVRDAIAEVIVGQKRVVEAASWPSSAAENRPGGARVSCPP